MLGPPSLHGLTLYFYSPQNLIAAEFNYLFISIKFNYPPSCTEWVFLGVRHCVCLVQCYNSMVYPDIRDAQLLLNKYHFICGKKIGDDLRKNLHVSERPLEGHNGFWYKLVFNYMTSRSALLLFPLTTLPAADRSCPGHGSLQCSSVESSWHHLLCRTLPESHHCLPFPVPFSAPSIPCQILERDSSFSDLLLVNLTFSPSYLQYFDDYLKLSCFQ